VPGGSDAVVVSDTTPGIRWWNEPPGGWPVSSPQPPQAVAREGKT